jgi:hypothetical protein
MDGKLGRSLLVLAFVAGGSGPVRATDDSSKATARTLAKEAKRDFDAGHLADAELKFRQAYAIAKVPTLALWTARVLVKRGQFVAGAESYRQAAQLAPNDFWVGHAQERAQADAKRELEALQPRISRLRIHVQGAAPDEVAMTIDDVRMSGPWAGIDVPADPGRHRIVGKREGETLELTLDLLEGEGKDAILKFREGDSAAALATRDGEPAPDLAAKAFMGSDPARVDGAANLAARSVPPEPASSSRPIYTKWWFWTGVGAAVIAGSVTAFVLTRHSVSACSGASFTCVEVP